MVFSSDGLHWGQPITTPEIEANGTHTNAFWAPHLDRYVGISRQHADGVRLVTRAKSTDFAYWTRDQTILRGPNSHPQTRDMIVLPTNGIYIGLLARMVYPDGSDRNEATGVKQHVELVWSPDTVTWYRIQEGTPFIGYIPEGTKTCGAMPYDRGTIFASAPIFLNDEILYILW